MRHDCVLSVAQKRFDLEVLFDPFEEQFNLPSLLVNIGNGVRRPAELVGNEDIVLARFRVAVTDAANRPELVSVLTQRRILDRLITGDAAAFIHRMSFKHPVFGVAADAADKENTFLRQAVMPAIAVITFIKNQHTAARQI